jgi:hypothetical protein
MSKDASTYIIEKLEQCSISIASLVAKTDSINEKIISIDSKISEREKLNIKNIDLRINILWTLIGCLFSVILALALKVL